MVIRLLAASALAVGLAGCSCAPAPGSLAAFGGPPDGVAEAKQFRCPSARAVEQVTGLPTPPGECVSARARRSPRPRRVPAR